PDRQKIRFRAVALAGLGDLAAGLQEAERMEEKEILPLWLYWMVLSDVYSAARDEAKALAAATRAVEEAPENSTLLLSLALRVVLYSRDTRRARELLEEASRHALADVNRITVA